MEVLDRGTSHRKAIDPSIQEQLAKTYFRPIPSEDEQKNAARHNSRISFLPWMIAVLAALFSIALLLSKSDIDIKVRILSEVPSLGVKEDRLNDQKDKGISFVNGSEINSAVVTNTYFAGDAKNYSRVSDSELVLCNSRGAGWANYTIELKEPLDLTKLDLKYVAKGAKGGEMLGIVIVDADNRSYRVEGHTGKLTKDWRDYKVNFGPVRKAVGLNNISMIKLEFGSLTAQNSAMATIFLKGLYATKTKRMAGV